jgi:hypothetical protein
MNWIKRIFRRRRKFLQVMRFTWDNLTISVPIDNMRYIDGDVIVIAGDKDTFFFNAVAEGQKVCFPIIDQNDRTVTLSTEDLKHITYDYVEL